MVKVPKLFIATKAFITHKGNVLIVRESTKYKDGANVGKYDVVGGRVNPGQPFFNSLEREISEETGLKVKIGKPFFANEWWPKVRGEQWQIVGMFFECQAKKNKIKLSKDHDDFLWINPNQYKKYNLIKNLYPAFKAFIKTNNYV